MNFKALAIGSTFLAAVATSLAAGAPSRAGKWNVVDGCSTPRSVKGITRDLDRFFREACNNHDRCYATPGAVKPQCERNFYSDMISLCNERYSNLPSKSKLALFLSCNKAAWVYFIAVDTADKFWKVQRDEIRDRISADRSCQEKLLRGDLSLARGTADRRTCALNNYAGWYWGNNNHKAGVCPPGSFAYGFRQRVERSQGRGDDTALNGIHLNCRNIGGARKGGVIKVESARKWGTLGNWAYCPTGMWISGYRIKVEPYQDSWRANTTGRIFDLNVSNKDDTGTNAIQFKCRTADWRRQVVIKTNNDGNWGTWDDWRNTNNDESRETWTNWIEARPGLFVTAIHAHIEKPQGRGDDTAMNQVWFSVARKPRN